MIDLPPLPRRRSDVDWTQGIHDWLLWNGRRLDVALRSAGPPGVLHNTQAHGLYRLAATPSPVPFDGVLFLSNCIDSITTCPR